jgi:5-methylcytosine-specific restriction endonuclease McrA
MSDLKRIPIKYIRDFIKKDYKLENCCFVCDKTATLELHHIYSISELFNGWCDKNNIDKVDSVEIINDLRVRFYDDEYERLKNDNLYTLCKNHHERLHNIYGQRYDNVMAKKVINWLNIQKEKHGRSIST